MNLIHLVVILFCTNIVSSNHLWEKPGCHKVGHTRKINIPGCVEFNITTIACRGFCESYAVPSRPFLTEMPAQPVTSIGQCCNIMESKDVTANVLCLDGIRNLIFKSAISCQCFDCKKQRHLSPFYQ